MIQVNLANIQSFVTPNYETELAARVRDAHDKLQLGTGAGSDYIGWERLPAGFPAPGFWGEGAGGLARTRVRLEPSVSQRSPCLPAPGKGPLHLHPGRGAGGRRGRKRSQAPKGAWPSPCPSRRAARGSHGRALHERGDLSYRSRDGPRFTRY